MVIISHCIVNQNSVVYPLARAAGAFNAITQALLRQGLGIYQLPCPEMVFGGLGRAPLSYEQYDLPEYKRVCSELVERVLADLQLFAAGQCEIQFLVGIGQSPSCATTGKLGHFMELLLPRVVELFPKVKVVEIPADYREGSLHPFIEELEQ